MVEAELALTAGETDVDETDAEETAAAGPAPDQLPALVEALLFVTDGPVEPATLARALGVTPGRVRRALDELREQLHDRGVRLQLGPDGAQLVTAPHASEHVETFLGLEASRRLSTAALETMAIVAYRQPVTRATIESVRGVNSDGSIATLRSRALIEEAGRAPGPGRPALFVTTQRFLEHFGLERPQDLPELGDYELPPADGTAPLPLHDVPRAPGVDGGATSQEERWRGGGRTPDDARPQPAERVWRRTGDPLPGGQAALPRPSSHGPLPDGGRAALPGGGSPAF